VISTNADIKQKANKRNYRHVECADKEKITDWLGVKPVQNLEGNQREQVIKA